VRRLAQWHCLQLHQKLLLQGRLMLVLVLLHSRRLLMHSQQTVCVRL
jgi:hypothetical protein